MKRFAFTVLFFLLFLSVIPVFADYGEIIQIAGYQVTFTVENGTFDDGSTERTVTLDVDEYKKARLGEDDIPAVGNKPDTDFKKGYWEPYTPNIGTEISEDTEFCYFYEEKDLVTYTVKFYVNNGTFKNGSTEFVLTKEEDRSDGLTLEAGDIPALEPKEGYQGSWSPSTPAAGTNIKYNENPKVFTYTYTPKTPFSYEVTFKAVNGTFIANTTLIGLTLEGYKEDGEELELTADQIPKLGQPDEGYKPGSWDKEPKAGTEITGNTTFTYTYAKKKTVSYRVFFFVSNGKWDDGSGKKKEVILEGFEDEPLNLKAEDIPSAGSKPDPGYQEGSWDGDAPSPDTVIIEGESYFYKYAKIPSIEQMVEPLTAVPEGLTEIYHDDLNALEQALLDGLKIHGQSAQIDQTLFVDVQASFDGGIEWKSSIGEDLLPEGGLRVDIPYPKGTGRDTHDFGERLLPIPPSVMRQWI